MNNTVALLFLRIISNFPCDPDYYWRDYHGKIPPDAVEGGMDVMGDPTYIGQAFVIDHGILIGQIYPGKKSITTSRKGIYVTDIYNKILCSGHKENFSWIPVNASTLHLTTINKHLVSGGIESGKVLNIGRIKHQNEIIVGRVRSDDKGKAKLWLTYRVEEIQVGSYQILAYEENPLCKKLFET